MLCACQKPDDVQQTATSAEEVGNIYVSAYPPVAWTDIADKLAPKNNLTIDQARQWAVQTTQTRIAQFLSSFAAGLALQTPGGGGTAIPNAPTASSLAPNLSPPNLNQGPLANAIDGNTLISTSSALYQQAQILDNQISSAIFPQGYRLHLVTFQVNLQPNGRYLDYDAYVDISLLPSDLKKAMQMLDDAALPKPPVVIYPLIIMDALEAANVGRSVEDIRQAAFQLSGMIAHIGAAASLSDAVSKLDSTLGMDKNSLVTVGRVDPWTVRVRLGAENVGSVNHALVPRSYNVSLAVMTRWDETELGEHVGALKVVTHSTFHSGDLKMQGLDPLKSTRGRTALACQIRRSVLSYGYGQDFSPDACAPGVTPARLNVPASDPAPCPETPGLSAQTTLNPSEVEGYLNLLRYVDHGDYGRAAKCLGKSALTPIQAGEEERLDRMLSSLVEIQTNSRYSDFSIVFRAPDAPTLPPQSQLVLYGDDAKTGAAFIVRGGKGLAAKELQSVLHVTKKGKAQAPYGILPSSLTLVGNGAEIDIVYPSLDKSGLVLGASPPLCITSDKSTVCYAVSSVPPSAPKTIGNPVLASSAALVSDANGVARLTLQIGAFDTTIKTPLRLTVEGADVRPNAAIGAVGTTSKGIALTPNSTLVLELGNLSPTHDVTLKTVDSSASATTIGAPITLRVERFSPK